MRLPIVEDKNTIARFIHKAPTTISRVMAAGHDDGEPPKVALGAWSSVPQTVRSTDYCAKGGE